MTSYTTSGGKGGAKPDQARGAAPDREKLKEMMEAAQTMLVCRK